MIDLQSFPSSVQAAFRLMEEILSHRSDLELQGGFKTKKQQWRHVPDDNENGNIGKLVFAHENDSLGLNWIAASPNANLQIECDVGEVAVELRHLGDGRIVGTPTTNVEPKGLMAEAAYQADPGRWMDSEYMLITFLRRVLRLKGFESGHLYLITERIPCKSCTSVIDQFLGEFPAVRCSIFYCWDSYNRGNEEFLADPRVLDVELHKLIWDGSNKTLNMITLRSKAQQIKRQYSPLAAHSFR
jgi:The  BURPS668_1122 family of deaminases